MGPAIEVALATALLQSLWQGAALALIAAALFSIFRSATMRHAVGMTVLLAMAIAPLLTFMTMMSERAEITAVGLAARPAGTAIVPFAALPETTATGAPLWLGWLWIAGVVLATARLAGGWAMLRRLDLRGFEPLPPASAGARRRLAPNAGHSPAGRDPAAARQRAALYRARPETRNLAAADPRRGWRPNRSRR